MKNIQELLETAAGHLLYSCMDATSGFHHIPMAQEDKEKTAFSIPGPAGGQYQFKVMPFGLNNAPATFQQFMDDTFRPHLGKHTVVYIDDICVYSNSEEEHLA